MRTKTTMIINKKLGRIGPKTKRMPYEEPIGRQEPYRVLKKHHQEELGRIRQRSSHKKQQSGEKTNTTTVKKNLAKKN